MPDSIPPAVTIGFLNEMLLTGRIADRGTIGTKPQVSGTFPIGVPHCNIYLPWRAAKGLLPATSSG